MKVLTVRQPWATLIRDGHKSIELRTWSTPYRGPLLIHGAKQWARHQKAAIEKAGLDPNNEERFPVGCMVCLVDLVDVHSPQRGDTKRVGYLHEIPDGHLCWVLQNPRPVENVACEGKLGLWDPPAGILKKLGLRGSTRD